MSKTHFRVLTRNLFELLFFGVFEKTVYYSNFDICKHKKIIKKCVHEKYKKFLEENVNLNKAGSL